MDAIRTAALAAVAEAGPAWNGGAKVAQAMRLVRVKTGCRLADARDAVLWAIERPAAATLPFNSVVAGETAVFIKLADADEASLPWHGTSAAVYFSQCSDADIDDLLRSDRAQILRVGAS